MRIVLRLFVIVSVDIKIFSEVGIWWFSKVIILSVKVILVVIGMF